MRSCRFHLQAKARDEIRVQYADEAIVVIKPVPKKASNRLEDKIQVTHHTVDVTIIVQKIMVDAKGERDFKVYQKEFKGKVKVLKEG